MTAKTRIVELRRDVWQQLCDGTQNVFVQVLSACAEFVVADSEPSADAFGNILELREKIGFTPPPQVWMRGWGGAGIFQQPTIGITPNEGV